MLNWLESLYADWRRRRRTGVESETATSSGDDATGTADAERAVGGPTDGAVTQGCDVSTSRQDLVDGEQVSKQEVHLELGLHPPEFLAWLVRDAGGRMWQVDLVETTGWSASSVSRYLCSLESDGAVYRVEVGRQKLVCVPGRMPDVVPTPDGPSTDAPSADAPSADSPTGSWTPEVEEPA